MADARLGPEGHLDIAHRFARSLSAFGEAYVTPGDYGGMVGLRGTF